MNKKIVYEEEEAGKWIYPRRKGYRVKCCDCGLVHVFDFRLVEGKYIEFRAFRDNRATGQIRRHMERKKVIKTKAEKLYEKFVGPLPSCPPEVAGQCGKCYRRQENLNTFREALNTLF